ncbi:hypothetical protein ACTHGU_08020 [Chitinophagaceae bacterium MMS25-I14]
MTRLSVLGCSFFAAMTLFSCKKNHDSPATPIDSVVYVDYGALKPGNHWVYEIYTVDSLGNSTSKGYYDSAYVKNDTTIGNNIYHILMKSDDDGGDVTPHLLRDSLHYIVDEKGKIYFSSQDFTTTFSSIYVISSSVGPTDSVGLRQTQMADKNLSITVPAGTFVTSSFRTIWHLNPAFSQYTRLVRRLDTRYAAGIGIVSETLPFYLSYPNNTEKRLVRYYVQ